MHPLLVLTVVLVVRCSAWTVNLCDESGFIEGGVPKDGYLRGERQILRTIPRLRTRVECATYCFSDEMCKVAVLRSGGSCELLSDFYNELNVTATSGGSTNADEFVVFGSYSLSTECENACSDGSVCVYDCSAVPGQQVSSCVDMEGAMYTSGECRDYPTLQFKEYYLSEIEVESVSSSKMFFSVVFNKKYDWTALRVSFRGQIRGGNGGGRWNWWYIRFNNNQDCTSPSRIQAVNYNAETDTDHHKATGMIGMCNNLPAGDNTVEFWFYPSGASNGYLGHGVAATRLYVEELGYSGADINDHLPNLACPGLPNYNAKQYYHTGSWGHDHSTTLLSWTYRKREDDTVLRMNMDVVLRVYAAGSSEDKCSAWYLQIDGANCKPAPIGRIIANLGNSHYVNNEHRSCEFEGYCTGISAGDHSVQLRVERCPWSVNTGTVSDTETGWNGNMNRMLIEEIRLGTDVTAVRAPDGRVYRIPQFNFDFWYWSNAGTGQSNGQLVSMTYKKKYADSGIRVVYSGDQRNLGASNTGAYSLCCRHFFTFNGSPCGTPGEIDGATYLNKNINLHRPIMIDGICDQIPSGDVIIGFSAGMCRGHTKYGVCYAMWNSYTHIMVSETYTEREIITA